MRRGSAPLDAIPGFPPVPGSLREGCVFAPRCGLADDRCRAVEPPFAAVGEGRASRCHYPDRVGALPRATPAPARAAIAATATALPVLHIEHLSKIYGAGRCKVHALRDVSLALMPGETLGLVGESGSGKSTLAHALLGLIAPDPGSRVLLDGPHHPYTEALLSAAPSVSGERSGRIRLSGAIPSAPDPPSGCVFHARCPRHIGPICDEEEPAFAPDAEGHAIRCHLPREDLGRAGAPVSALSEPA